VNAFAGLLHDAVDPEAVQDDLTGLVHAALEPVHVTVWVDAGPPRG
jgi:hypothetical protein